MASKERSDLAGRRVAVLMTDGVERVEYTRPRKILEQHGAPVTLVSPKSEGEQVQGFNHLSPGDKFAVEMDVRNARAGDFDAGIAQGSRLISWPSLREDLRNAGAEWSDEAVVVDSKRRQPQVRRHSGVRPGAARQADAIGASKPGSVNAEKERDMQVTEIKQRFNEFEQHVEEALRACERDSNVSPQLVDTLRNLDREAHQAHDMVQNAQSQSDQLVECIDHLEEMGDEAKRACQSASSVNPDTRDSVLDLHKEISTLKHQLH